MSFPSMENCGFAVCAEARIVHLYQRFMLPANGQSRTKINMNQLAINNLKQRLDKAAVGNKVKTDNGWLYLSLFAICLFWDKLTWADTILQIVMGMMIYGIIATNYQVAFSKEFAELLWKSYDTDMHMPWWADVIGYSLCFLAVWFNPQTTTLFCMTFICISDFGHRYFAFKLNKQKL